jgi:hypothetical protein
MDDNTVSIDIASVERTTMHRVGSFAEFERAMTYGSTIAGITAVWPKRRVGSRRPRLDAAGQRGVGQPAASRIVAAHRASIR